MLPSSSGRSLASGYLPIPAWTPSHAAVRSVNFGTISRCDLERLSRDHGSGTELVLHTPAERPLDDRLSVQIGIVQSAIRRRRTAAATRPRGRSVDRNFGSRTAPSAAGQSAAIRAVPAVLRRRLRGSGHWTGRIPLTVRDWPGQAEGEGFEPSSDPEARNGFRDRRIRPLCHPSERENRPEGPASHGEGGIRTLDGAIQPHNALAGRRLQPLGHFSGPADGTAPHRLRWPPRCGEVSERSKERDWKSRTG